MSLFDVEIKKDNETCVFELTAGLDKDENISILKLKLIDPKPGTGTINRRAIYTEWNNCGAELFLRENQIEQINNGNNITIKGKLVYTEYDTAYGIEYDVYFKSIK